MNNAKTRFLAYLARADVDVALQWRQESARRAPLATYLLLELLASYLACLPDC